VDALKQLQAAELDATLPSVVDKAFKGEWGSDEFLLRQAPDCRIPTGEAVDKTDD
jgi:hypothetical protein